jgi:Spy/CpxP family protein refolding chaperone
MTAGVRWRITLGLLLVFFAGMATGVFAGAWHAHQAFARGHDDRLAERMRARLTRDLNLTPDQLQQVGPILDDTARRLQEIRAESGRRVSETLKQSHEQLATHLTPEQREELRDIEQQHRRFWRRGPRPPRPDL